MDMLKQKLYGIALVIVGILTIIPEHDATATLLLVPMGLGVIFTKDKVVDF